MFNLSLSISINMPLPTNILKDYTLNLRECLREAVMDRDFYKEITDTLMEDIKERSNVHESELAAFRAVLD